MDLYANNIGQDGLNEVLKLMELTSNCLEKVHMRRNEGYLSEQYELVSVLDVLSRNEIQLFLKLYLF